MNLWKNPLSSQILRVIGEVGPVISEAQVLYGVPVELQLFE